LTVNQDSSACGVYFNTSSPITFPETFIVYTNCSSAYTLYLNGSVISNGTEVNSGANYFNFSVQRTDTLNYTDIFDDEFFTVSKYSNTATLTLTPSNSETYGTETTASCSSGIGTPKLYKDLIEVSNPDIHTFGVGTYDYVCNISNTQNYTSATDSDTLTIIKASPSGSISGTSPITYGTAGDVEGTEDNIGDGGCVYKLYREGVEVSNPDNDILV